MKKILSFLTIFFIITSVIMIGAFFIIKNEMRPEKLAKRIEQISKESGFHISFGNIDYALSWSGINAAIYDVNVDNENIDFMSGKINLNINVLRFLFKEIVVNKMTVYNGVAIIKPISDENKDIPDPDDHYMLSSDVFLKNCMIIYDTINIDSITGSVNIMSGRELSVTGSLYFVNNIKYLDDLGGITLSFALISGKKQNLIINNMSIGSNVSLKGNISLYEDTIKYNLISHINEINEIMSESLLYVNTDIPISLFCRGKYIISDSLIENAANIDSINCSLGSGDIKISSITDTFMLKSGCIVKSGNSININTQALIYDVPFIMDIEMDYDSLLNKHIVSKFSCDNADLSVINNFISNIHIKGYSSIEGEADISADSLGVIKHIINNTDMTLRSEKLSVRADTFEFLLENTFLEKQNIMVNVTGKTHYRGFNVDLQGMLNLEDSTFNGAFKCIGNITSIAADYEGVCNVEGNGFYRLKGNKFKANATFTLDNVTGKGFQDTIDIIGENVAITGNNDINTKNIQFNGKHIEGNISSMHIVFRDRPVVDIEAQFKHINIDSLIPISDSAQQTKTEKPEIYDDLIISFKGFCNNAVFRGENVNNLKIDGKLINDTVYIDSFSGSVIGGTARGSVIYMPEIGFLTMRTILQNIDVNEFLVRHPLMPYDMGGGVDAQTNISFFQDSLRESVQGHIITEIKGGYMMSPSLLTDISKVIRYPISDTFFFETMYGEFDIKNETVFFDDFIMERNGHSLEYSGNVDFDKRIFVDGFYNIDLNISDLGLFESLLRNAGYQSDSVSVQFELLGNYKMPAVSIKKNSIGDYLKSSTQNVVDDFINNINNLFKM